MTTIPTNAINEIPTSQWPVLLNYYDRHNDDRCDAPNCGVTYDRN